MARMTMLLVAMALAFAASARTQLIVVSGIGGDEEYAQRFRDWSLEMLDAARDQLGLAQGQAIWLCERPALEPARCAGESRRERVLEAIAALDPQAPEPVMVLLIGHGTYRDGRALFNLPGPDLSATDLSAALSRLRDRPLAVVNTAPSSSPFVPTLARPGRVVISATARSAENDHTRFAAHFVSAFGGAADADKDGRVSLLEAFRFTVHELAREYESKQQVATEHALLDDNGDGEGARAPEDHAGDGAAAARFFLAAASTGAPDSPRRRSLEQQARSVLAEIGALRKRRAAMETERYLQTLEALLVGLALNRRALREANE
jgi:hypothetical protein